MTSLLFQKHKILTKQIDLKSFQSNNHTNELILKAISLSLVHNQKFIFDFQILKRLCENRVLIIIQMASVVNQLLKIYHSNLA